jgi:hypothetical protein
MNGDADRAERIKAALARYEKRTTKSGKPFSVDEPQRELVIMGPNETRERWEERS